MPSPFDALLSLAVGQASRQFVGVDPTTTAVVRMAGRLQEHVFGRWRAAGETRLPCAVRFQAHNGTVGVCTAAMIGACICCEYPVCIEHANVSLATGDPICFGCIELARQARASTPRGAPQSTQVNVEQERKLRRKYLRMLKLKGQPSEDEIRQAFKREAAKAHPDRQPAADKDKAHKRFVELGTARDWLLERARKDAA